ncbi:MAG: CmcI family methyltransferase [Methanobrevibacter boviskoreani]|jgi:cephalosporin hydroxylase|uniref:CmcI family methyltransferase n=1 Tax=Methanobrevibacter boviskoreani TaxID=1348249 RepID=UPI00059463A8|nr:class I SAM-dependent methyltransferase [Methanobrevibacter boviskoreani]
MIKLNYDIKLYRKSLMKILKPTDTVIELGCHVGGSSKIIAEILEDGQLISLDNSPEAINKMEKLQEEYSNIKFISGDVRLHDIIQEVYKITQSADVLSVDLGGGYHPDTVFKVYYIWSSTFKPRDSIIRNKGIIDFVNTAQLEENIVSEKGYLDSYNDEGIPPQIKEFNLWTNSLKNK